jgi:hypothetical protein
MCSDLSSFFFENAARVLPFIKQEKELQPKEYSKLIWTGPRQKKYNNQWFDAGNFEWADFTMKSP